MQKVFAGSQQEMAEGKELSMTGLRKGADAMRTVYKSPGCTDKVLTGTPGSGALQHSVLPSPEACHH